MSAALTRLNKISEIVGLIVKIIMILIVVAMVGVCLAAIAIAVFPDIQLDIAPELTVAVNAAVFATMVIVLLVIIFAILYYIDRLFTGITKNNTPFTDDSVENLRMIAILMVVTAVAAPIMGGILVYFFDFSGATVFGFDPLILFVAFLIYIISLVFSHGTALQKESDVTL
jgi:hypothetical protein